MSKGLAQSEGTSTMNMPESNQRVGFLPGGCRPGSSFAHNRMGHMRFWKVEAFCGSVCSLAIRSLYGQLSPIS